MINDKLFFFLINHNFYSKISQEQKHISCGNYQPRTSLLNDVFLIFSLVLKPDNLQGVSSDQF